jgi:hypothetical protein
MTDLAPAAGTEPPFRQLEAAALDVRLMDVLVALITFAGSLAVLAYGMSAEAYFAIFLLLHLAVLALPAWILKRRIEQQRDLTIPVLLVISTAGAGALGAIGCAAMGFLLWCRRPTPWRLQHWYDYISGVVRRRRVAHLYDELVSGRLPSDPAAKVPRFNPILHDTSLDDQQRVLSVIGRRYHPDFRPTLRKAIRHKNGFIRAQAAAVASRLNPEERARLWSTAEEAEQTGAGRIGLDVEPPRP